MLSYANLMTACKSLQRFWPALQPLCAPRAAKAVAPRRPRRALHHNANKCAMASLPADGASFSSSPLRLASCLHTDGDMGPKSKARVRRGAHRNDVHREEKSAAAA